MNSDKDDKTTQDGQEPHNICSLCGKRVLQTDRAGSLATNMLRAFYCSCSDGSGLQPRQSRKRPRATAGFVVDSLSRLGSSLSKRSGEQEELDGESCEICGLLKAAPSKPGSLTGYLFQDLRCKCFRDELCVADTMVEKFWNLKLAGDAQTSQSADRDKEPLSGGIESGELIGNSYRVISLLGRGGMGEVYSAEHINLKKRCALKIIQADQVTELSWKRFKQEAKVIARLKHINLVQVTDLGIHNGSVPYYAMDYIEGKTLAELLYQGGPMPLNLVIQIFSQVCDGIEYAHRAGIVHRDLKPANIMVSRLVNGGLLVKILDFGLAKLREQGRDVQSFTAAGAIFGSPLYMSPEQCRGEKVDARGDLYSLGCTIFECLTGRTPFESESWMAVFADHEGKPAPELASIVGKDVLPPSIETVVAKLLRKLPSERYQTAFELRRDLHKVAKGEEVQFYISSTRSNGSSKDKFSAVNLAGGRSKVDSSLSGHDGEPGEDLGLFRVAAIAAVSLGVVVISVMLWFGNFYHGPDKAAYDTAEAVINENNRTNGRAMISMKETFFNQFDKRVENLPTRIVDRSKPTSVPKNYPLKPIKSVFIKKAGETFKQLEFPPVLVGYIGVNKPNEVEAQGHTMIKSRADTPLFFDISFPACSYTFDQPDVLRAIDCLEFTRFGVSIESGRDLSDQRAGQEAQAQQKVIEILSIVCKWSRLDTLAIHGVEDYPGLVESLDLFKHLRVLSLDSTSLSLKKLAATKIIGQLESLEITDPSDVNVDPLLEVLGRSKNLETLHLANVRVGDGALNALLGCPRLQDLSVSLRDLGPANFNALRQFKHLTSLSIAGPALTDLQLDLLTRGHKFQLTSRSKAYTDSELTRLGAKFRTVQFHRQ
jgi:serine/threonine protein kinase